MVPQVESNELARDHGRETPEGPGVSVKDTGEGSHMGCSGEGNLRVFIYPFSNQLWSRPFVPG